MERSRAEAFAREWVTAWNDRDIEAILVHYDDAIIFHSPRIAKVMGAQVALIRGKAALRAYWVKALELAPTLYFEIDRVLTGSDSLTICYNNHRDQGVAETFVFGPDGSVVESLAAYE